MRGVCDAGKFSARLDAMEIGRENLSKRPNLSKAAACVLRRLLTLKRLNLLKPSDTASQIRIDFDLDYLAASLI